MLLPFIKQLDMSSPNVEVGRDFKNFAGHHSLPRDETMDPFAYHLDESDLKRERQKARELRESQWWKRRLAKGVCHYCGSPTSPKELTMDHIVPIARGGRSTKGNVAPACKTCNNAKKELLPMEWEKYLDGKKI